MRTQIKVDGVWIGGSPQLGEWYKQEVAQDVWQEQRFIPQSLDDAKSARIALIKSEARQRISATDWEVTKYSERKQRGKPGSDAKYNDVLDVRDSIRTDSDLAEEAINALATIEEVNSFVW